MPPALRGIITTGQGTLPDFCGLPQDPQERAALIALYDATGGGDGDRDWRLEKLEEWEDLEDFGVGVSGRGAMEACIEDFESVWVSEDLRIDQLYQLRDSLKVAGTREWDSLKPVGNIEGELPGCIADREYDISISIDELDRLIDNKDYANHFGWQDQNGWMTAAHIGVWSGVTVDSRTGHVTDLDLAGNNLNGRIPRELGNLSELQTLNLSENESEGGIPASLARLTNLEALNLSSNRLTGELPPELQEISSDSGGKLKYIYLFDNEFSGCVPRDLIGPLESGLETASEAFIDYVESPVDAAAKWGVRFIPGFSNSWIPNISIPLGWAAAYDNWVRPTYGVWLPPCAPEPPDPYGLRHTSRLILRTSRRCWL